MHVQKSIELGEGIVLDLGSASNGGEEACFRLRGIADSRERLAEAPEAPVALMESLVRTATQMNVLTLEQVSRLQQCLALYLSEHRPKAVPLNLTELLWAVTPQNLHEEISVGPEVGREVW